MSLTCNESLNQLKQTFEWLISWRFTEIVLVFDIWNDLMRVQIWARLFHSESSSPYFILLDFFSEWFLCFKSSLDCNPYTTFTTRTEWGFYPEHQRDITEVAALFPAAWTHRTKNAIPCKRKFISRARLLEFLAVYRNRGTTFAPNQFTIQWFINKPKATKNPTARNLFLHYSSLHITLLNFPRVSSRQQWLLSKVTHNQSIK